ncbi:MAG: SDR family oxidoreductase [Pseudomonadales bacterium]|nr:SDR family oxidoreductase [Pseudomonadales bacterium]
MELTNKTILITGASSGIGRKIAELLSYRNNRLVLIARRETLLAELAEMVEANGSQALIFASNALDESSAEECVEQAVKAFKTIDVALLNIGDGPSFNMATVTAADVKHNMSVNYDSMVNYLVPIIKVMKAQGSGTIAHTNSLAGFLGLPMQGPYSAAKAAGRILLDSCRIELEQYGIRVVSLYPGFVATDRIKDDGIPHPFQISEETAAKEMIKGIEQQKSDHLFPAALKLLIKTSNYLPKPAVSAILKRAVPEAY